MAATKLIFSVIIALAIILPTAGTNLFVQVKAEDDGEFEGGDDGGDSGDTGDDSSSDSGDSSDGGTTEDDGYIYPDNSTPEEQQAIDDQEQQAWEDAGRPGDTNNNDNGNTDDQQESSPPPELEQIECPDGIVVDTGDYCPDVTTCPDGSTIAVGQTCPSPPPPIDEPTPAPYCDTDAGKAASTCWDRYDYSDDTGLASCNDGTHKKDPLDCKDVTAPTAQVPTTLVPPVGPENSPDLKNCPDGTLSTSCPDAKNNNKLPRCVYKAVQDCILNDLGQTCLIGTTEDACQDIFYGYNGANYKPGEKIVDPAAADDKNKINGNSNSNIGSSSSSSSSSTTKTIVVNPNSATTTSTAADASNCKLDGSADGIQQKFDTAKYESCKLHIKNDRIYYDGFVAGCMQVGNTKLICEAVADSNLLNIQTQPTQIQTTTQTTQAIQPATATVGE